MIGAMAGDIIGSRFEFNNIGDEDFGPLFADKCVFTDDTVLTVATAEVLLDVVKKNVDLVHHGLFGTEYLHYAQAYANRGYGGNFYKMVKQGRLEPYDSYGNGSAMRVSPVGWRFNSGNLKKDLLDTVWWAKTSADCTHNHAEGVKGARAVAGAICLARNGRPKEDIARFAENLGYDVSKKTYDFKQGEFDVTCQGTIPRCVAIILETDDFESAQRRSVRMGGDTDTNCAIVGSICEGLYGLPDGMIEDVYARIPKQMADVVTEFRTKYIDENFVEPEEIGTKTATLGEQLQSLF